MHPEFQIRAQSRESAADQLRGHLEQGISDQLRGGNFDCSGEVMTQTDNIW